MKSKGPVDFFLGVFLEFGAAFCLLFFLPHVPWHWLPGESSTSPSASPPIGVTTTERRVLLRPIQLTLSNARLSQTVPQFPQAPPLLQPELEPSAALPVTAPQSASAAARPQAPALRRDFPRQYRY